MFCDNVDLSVRGTVVFKVSHCNIRRNMASFKKSHFRLHLGNSNSNDEEGRLARHCSKQSERSF